MTVDNSTDIIPCSYYQFFIIYPMNFVCFQKFLKLLLLCLKPEAQDQKTQNPDKLCAFVTQQDL